MTAQNKEVDHGFTTPLPSSIEAEQALLGAIFCNNELFYSIDKIRVEHLYEPLHQRIFLVIERIVEKGRIADPMSVAQYMTDDPVYEEIGGKEYLMGLAGGAAMSDHFNVRHFCQVIYDAAVRRGVIQVADDMSAAALHPDPDTTTEKILEEAEASIYGLASTGTYSQVKNFSTALAEAAEQTEAAFKSDGSLQGASTTIPELDRITGGIQRGHLVVLGARPAMGKSAFAGQIAWKAASNPEDPRKVLLNSMEMSAAQYANRVIASESGISYNDIHQGNINREQFERYAEVISRINLAPLYTDETGGLSLGQISSRARRQKRTTGLDLMVIDYLQLMDDGARVENRVQGLTKITIGLKALAKELDCGILLLSQLSRAVEQREDKRPKLADLRESGSIEQDADMVLFLFREHYYLSQRGEFKDAIDELEHEDRLAACEKLAEINVAKNRHGRTGRVMCQAHLDTMQFLPEYAGRMT